MVKELLEKYPAMAVAKNQADKLIDLNGPKSTGGTGIKQLRENIAESKLSYEIMDDAAQVENCLYLTSDICHFYFKFYYQKNLELGCLCLRLYQGHLHLLPYPYLP